VLASLKDFVNHEFKGLLSNLREEAAFEFVELMKLLVFAHRHNKNDEFLKDRLIDFTIVREPMYKYSRNAQDKFFDYATFAFLFAWFEANPQAKIFSSEKFAENENPDYPVRMTAEITQLGQEATLKLHSGRGSPAGSSKQYKAFMPATSADQMRRCLEKYLSTAQTKWQGSTKLVLSPESPATSAASSSPAKAPASRSVAAL